jgi:hypothetical protein|tara:strand:+ start:239 stop:544 length:306 start_codon:yes stop_codon:yes gene_type:complete
MARPKKYNIDNKQIQKLATLGCTNKEIAEFFGCSPDLLEKSYSEFLTKGRAEQKIRLRQLQWRSAEKGNVVMQIFLGKNMLGQQDKLEETQLEEPLIWSND